MMVLRGCIAAEYQVHLEDIDIGVGDEILLGDLVLRISGKLRISDKANTSDVDHTVQRMGGLMADLLQFGYHVERLCPSLNELFCICLHAMVYATVDIMDKRPVLPTVEEIEIIINQLPEVQGAELKKKELVVRGLITAYRHAMDQASLRMLPIVTRRKVLAAL